MLFRSRMLFGQLDEFLVEGHSSRCFGDILVFNHQFPLDLQRERVVLHDHPDDVVSGFGGVEMADHPGALLNDRFEKITRQFGLASFAVLERDIAPHVGSKNDVLQCRVTTKFLEHPEVPPSDSGKSPVGDAVDVDDSSKRRASLVSVKGFIPGDQETANAEVDSRGGQESCDHLQNIRIAL